MDRRLFLKTTASALAGISAGGGRALTQRSNASNQIRSFLEPFAARHDFSGVVAVQTTDGRSICETFGYADFESRTATRRSNSFGVESVSKLFTVECLKSLKTAGKLTLDDPLSKWISDFPNGSAITLRMLAQHTAGLARDLSQSELDRQAPHSTAEVVEACKRVKPVGVPGAGFNYSNNGYRVLARVIELAGGGTYPGLVKETVFQPNAMSSTVEWSVGETVPNLAKSYLPGVGWASVVRSPSVNMTNYRGAASFCSTADDLLKFAASQQPTTAIAAKAGEHPSIGHDGFGHGYVATCFRYPVEKTSIVVAGNVESGLFNSLKASLERIVFDGSAKPIDLPTSGMTPGAISADLLGSYDLFGSELVLDRDASGNYFVDAGDGPTSLISIGTDTLFSRVRYATLRRQVDAGQVVLGWSEPSGNFTLKKRTWTSTLWPRLRKCEQVRVSFNA